MMSRLGAVFIALLASSAFGQDSRIGLDRDELVRLRTIWEGREAAIQSARIEFRFIPIAPLWAANLPRDQALELLLGIDWSDRESIEDGIGQLTKEPLPFDVEGTSYKLKTDGERTIESTEKVQSVIGSGESIRADRINHQIDLFGARGPIFVHTLRDLKPRVPQIAIDSLDLGSFEIRPLRDGVLELEFSTNPQGYSARFLIDPSSGDVSRFIMSRHHRGNVIREQIWREYRQFPGDVSFPTQSFQVDYRDGNLIRAYVRLIDEAEFGVEIDEAEFAVAYDASHTIVDHRGPRRHVYRPEGFGPDVRDARPPRRRGQ